MIDIYMNQKMQDDDSKLPFVEKPLLCYYYETLKTPSTTHQTNKYLYFPTI